MNAVFVFIAFFVAAILLWGIAELNYRNFHYKEDQPHHPDPTAHNEGEHKELSVRDIMRDNSTRGYSAV